MESIFNGLSAASNWIGNNVEYVENSPVGQWIGNNVEYVENSPVGQALAPANSIFQNWPVLLGLAANAAVTPQDNDTFSGSLYDAGVNGVANTVGNIADLMHKDDLAAAMYTLANKTQDNAPVQADWDWNYITNPHGLTRSFGNVIGSMAPLLPAMALAPESLVAAAGRLSPWLANGVRYGFTAIPEAMAEGGQTRREAIENGLDHPDLRAFGTMAKNLPLLAVSNTLEGAILGGGLGKMLAGKAGESVLSRMAKAPFRATPSALAEGLQNGLEEGLQQGIQNASVDKEYGYLPWNWTDDQWGAAKEGFFGTLPLGGIGGARKAIFPGAGGVTAATENGPDNTDPVVVAQLTGKNDDVPTADGIDVTNLDPQQYTQWYGEKLKSQGIDVPDATITVQTPKAQQTSGTGSNAKSGAPSYDASALEGAPQYTISDEVSSTDVTPLTDQKMRLLDSAYYNKYGQHLYITSMKRNGNPDESWHNSGQAFDTADDNLANNKEARDWLVSEGEKLGLTPLDEYENPSAHATGGHIHFSDHGDPIPEGATKNTQAQNTQEMANNGNVPAADLSSLPVGDIATAIAQNTGLPANFIWAQLSHESDGGNSKLAREDHNYGGVKGTDGEYLHFDNDQQFIDYMSNCYPKYREDGIYDAQTADQFAEALQHGGYFTADLGEYEGGMHRYLEQAGLSDSGTAGAPTEKQSTVNTMTQQQFGDMLNEKMIDFAGTNDDTVKAVFNDMSTSKDKALVALFAPYMQDGAFANTAANREALVGNDGFKKAMAMFLSKHLSDYAPVFENGRISFQQAEDALRPRHQQDAQATQTVQAPNIQTATTPQALIQMVQKGLNREQQGAILQVANTALHTPQGMANGDEAVWMNKLAKAIDEHDYPTIAQMIPNESMQALSAPKQGAPISMANTVMNPAGQTETEQAQFTQNAPANVVAMPAAQAPTNADTKNRVSSKVQGDAPVRQQATAERQAPQSEVASTVQGNIPVQQVAATKSETPQGEVASAVEANMPANQAPVRMNNQQAEQQAAPKKQGNVTPLPTQETQQSDGVRTAQPQPTIDEQNAQMDERIAAIKKQPLAQRKALGQQYLDTLRQNNVSFSEKKLAKPLMDGEPEALEHVQRTYGDLLNTITPAEAAAASQQTTPRTVHAIRAARLNGMMNEIAKGSTFKNASTMQKLAYLMTANSHAGMLRDQGKLDTIHNTIDKVRADAGLPGSGLTDGMTKEQRDSLYYETIKQQLDDEAAIRKEATDEDSDSLRGIDNDIKLLMRELADSRQKVKAARKENTNESTQSESQRTQDEGAKNQDQHAEPEPRKAADTQRKAEESEVSATKKAADKGGRDEQTLSEKEVVLKHISTLFGKPITNKETGIVATFGTKGANKMVSNKAVDKTVKNGYSQHEHLEAVKDIKRLYEDAGLSVQHEDRDKSPNILSIKRFRTNMTTVDGNPATAKITVKETKQNGHKIYSIELEALEKPSELNHARADSSEGQTVRPTKGKQPSSAYADESSSSTHIIPHEQKEGTKNLDSAKVPAMGKPIRGRTGKETTAASLFDNVQEAPAEEKTKKTTDEKKDESIFGSVEDADKEMLDALGLSEDDLTDDVLTAPSGIKNTAEERERLEKELSAELNKMSAMPMFNPKIYTLGLKLAMTYVKDGINTVKKLVAKLNAKFGDKIGPWAPALAETVRTWPKGVPFDEKKVMAISKAVGARYESGITSLDDMQADMKKLLKGQHDSFAPMIEASYNGIRKFFEAQKGENDHVDGSTSGLAERAGRGSDSDRVGPDDAGGESGRRSGRGVQETERAVQPEGGARVRDRSAAAGGETGNSRVQVEESGDRAGSAGSAHVSRSVRDSYEGSVGHDADRNAADIRPAQNRRDNASPAGARARAVKPNKSGKRGDLGSIKNDLPMLKPEQQEDVEFIETRVNVNNKPGVMLTNGTGTGKTYSGLGFVKRMYDAGKKNILIVSPGESINDQWIEAAGKHFELSIEKLDSTKDSGKDGGICITTYANLQENKELVNRNWDAIVSDESHTLMQNEKGEETGYLSMLRALTLNPRGAYKRWKLQHRTKEIRSLENQIEEREKKAKAILRPYKDKKKVSSADKAKVDALQKEIEDLNKEMEGIFWKMSPGTDKLMQDIKAAYPEEKRPKVLFLSATPFAHDKDVDYAEGYLFNYDDQPNTGAYNQGTPFDRFMIKHFGYRMRTNKLTRPDAEVDSRAMEVQFHDDLVNSGAMHGRQIDVDKDYDRGFILVDGGIGHKIDEGFKFLSDNHAAYGELQQALMKQFNKSQQKYLIESIKAREVIPLIQEYVKKGKKVVLFHQSMVEHKNIHPFQLKPSADLAENSEVWAQWKAFKSARPDLVNLSLGNIPAPMETLRKELGGHAVFINGSVLKKDRAKNIEQFNDDNSGVNIIVCQQDAANAGISLHDTTGKHPRVLINIAMPERPSYAMQIEGRIYRVGNASNAVFRYLSTGTDIEKNMFASTIGGRAASVENLAVGNAARGLRESFRDLYQETMDGSWRRRLPGAKGEGTGGKEMDYAVTADLSDYDRAKSFYFAHQKRTSRTKAQEGNDYFATPEPIGYKMVEWLGLKSGEKALEPSAGHGAISRWFPETTERTIVEPSGKLMPLAQMNTPGAKAVHGSFEDFNIVNKFDGIAMNPPYGTGGKTAIEHLQKAFKQLHDGGRVVAIIPEGPAADKRYSKMMEEISSEVVPIADIHLPAVAFSRAGTKVGTHIVVLDRYTGKAAHQAALDHFGGADDIDLHDIDDIKDLFDRMENMTLPERYDASNAHRVEPVPTPAVQLDEARVEGVPDETPNFTADEFEHTKTHEVKFRARPKSFLGENYRPIQKLAKAHGGYYSKFAKNSFLFEDEDERNAFLQEAEALLSDGKASAKGSAADMVKHIEFPAADTLTEREKAMQEFGQQMGVRVVFFDGPANLRGFYNKGITFINRSASKSPSWVFWHENLHWLRSNNPELYRQMVDYISGRQEFSPEQLQAYRDAIGRPELTDADTIEEMLADAMPDVHKRVDLFHKMGRENKSLIQRFFGWLRDTMAAFHNAFSQPKYGLSKTQAQAMRNALANIAEDLRDGEGRRIFRTRGADREILTAQGEELSYPVPDDSTKYSADKRDTEPAGSPGRMRRALVKLGLSTEQLKNVELRQAKGKQLDDISGWDMLAKSVRQVARKSPAVQYIYRLGRKALDEQEHLRNFYAQEIRKFNQYVKNPKILEETAQLLWEGDATGHAYTGDELQAMGVLVEAGRAYNLVRRVLADAYKRVNEARMQVKVRTEVIGRNDYREFIASHFLKPEDVLKAEMLRNGSMRVTYRGAKVYSKNEEVVSPDVYNRLRKDKDVYIKYAEANEDGTYTIGYTERVKPIHNLEGYMPHFFHHFMVYEKTKGDDGKEILVSLGSANSLKKATDLANQYAKANPKGQFVIRPHSFEYDEDYNNVVVGDKDYVKMMMQITKHTEMTLPEANAFLHDSVGVTKKGRHRFFGNAQHRKGAKGFDKDVQWALTHYLNASARYVAMEHFKPEAISFYERFFGDFNAEPKSNTARYIKNFINDMNGVPSYIEDELNKIVANIPFFGSRLNDAFEGRPALALSSSISWFNAVTKLGLGNFASAAINFMQFINIGTRLNSYAYANMGLKRALKPSDFDRRIIEESGVMDEVNLASDAGGYTQTRDYGRARKGLSKVKKGLDLAMIPFTKADSLMRKAAILGAYYQGVQEKGMKPEHEGEISRKAIEYAKDVNYDANFDYSTAAAPGAMRAGSVLTQQLFQFQKYPIMQFEFFWNNVVHAKDNKQRARFLVPYLLMSGAVGAVPFGALINAVASSLVGAGGDDDNDLAEEIKAEMMKWAGTDPMKRRLVNTVLYGILANANINISERVGMSNAFSGEYYGNKPESSAGALLQLFGGPLVSTVYNVATQIGNHNPIETIKAVSPSLGNMLQAVVGETRTTHHRVGTVYEDMYSRVMHALGFRSVDETNNSFVNSYLYKQKKQAQEDRKDAMDAYIRDPSSENRQRMTSLGVTDKTFKTYKENANKSSKERSQGEKKTKSKKPQTEAQKESSRLKDFTK
ncbi:DEAD/DEAH box helicase family protein [Mitsuokella multacida]|uniref:LPD3 domain-containing protein n=1 Tax=Mitsuokella multacida TaxID=52226 RepID=UPI0039F4FDA2